MNKNKQNINVDHISQLAAIELSDEEKNMFQFQLENILSYIDQLNEINISDIHDEDKIKLSLNDLRNDDPKKSISQEYVQKNAPEFNNNHISVPKILD
jgi:aspartyl-tRNA(Asn)/glutamyl-tRNA(Gln) amidotransferase subunit C